MGLEREEIDGLDGLRQLRPAWLALWRRCPDATPFQHPDWLVAYCEPFRVEQPWCLALWRDGQLVGLVPLVVYARGGERVATLLGAGISDYQDALLEPGVRTAALDAVFDWLAGARERWDVLELEHLVATSPLAGCWLPSEWRADLRSMDVCPVLRLPATVDQLAGVISPHLADNLRYARRRAERLGSLQYETATAATLEALLEDLVRLHRQRWSSRGEMGMLSPPMEAFHRCVARAFLEAGLLRLHAVRLDGQVIAVYYGFAAHRRAYYYLGGWDPAVARLSPGTLAVSYAIEAAIRAGNQEFDFLRGGEAYKYAWGARDRPTYTRSLVYSPARALEHAD